MSAQPRAIAPADTVIELQPSLHGLEADIASVYLARLEGLFDIDDLGLCDGAPREGSFLARIGKAEFWTCALCKKDQLRYSPAVHFYLHTQFDEQGSMNFHDYCQVWGQSFFAARHDLCSARDLLLLFLDQNLHCLKRLYILEQPHNQDLTSTSEALERCFDSPANAMLFVGDRFARWALEDWLPFHLRNVCCREFLAEEEGLARECPRTGMTGMPATCTCQ
ncbi:hypothetical protein [Noviherbaspirillum sp. ST9]|uniref:hypothetical protein n=1 Tax=Noviherbaspirillum sp. ST9 TaxID=3401606 RepID=UPI003B5892DC